MRIDNIVNGKLSRSDWFSPNGQVLFTTKWTDQGEGLEYYLYDDGSLKSKLEMVDWTANGTCWNYDREGNVASIETYLDGSIVADPNAEIPESTNNEPLRFDHSMSFLLGEWSEDGEVQFQIGSANGNLTVTPVTDESSKAFVSDLRFENGVLSFQLRFESEDGKLHENESYRIEFSEIEDGKIAEKMTLNGRSLDCILERTGP